MQIIVDEFADWFRVSTDYVEILGQVQALDKSVDHKRAKEQSQEGIESGGDPEHKATGQGDEKVCGQESLPDVKYISK